MLTESLFYDSLHCPYLNGPTAKGEKMKKAAGVLVLNGPRVLAFQRFDRAGLSLPCGKVEEGESPAEAALREGREETGLTLELIPDHQPFMGFDLVGGNQVWTYLAKVAQGSPEIHEVAAGEGMPVWASVREIAEGPYGHYNLRALRHFGVRAPLVGKFHSHLTIEAQSPAEAERAVRLVGGKLTVIDLSRDGRSQIDRMITHHFITGSRGLEDQLDIVAKLKAYALQLQASGVNVLRVKLEYDLLHEQSDRAQIAAALDNVYTEVHIKCVLSAEERDDLVRVAASSGWHPSRNPFAKRDDGKLVQFVNRRFYDRGLTLAQIDAAVDAVVPKLLERCEIEEIKYETAVYDSNDNHDHWWMAVEPQHEAL